MNTLSWHMRFKVAIVVEDVDRVILVIDRKHLPRIEHAPPRPVCTHKIADLEAAIRCSRDQVRALVTKGKGRSCGQGGRPREVGAESNE